MCNKVRINRQLLHTLLNKLTGLRGKFNNYHPLPFVDSCRSSAIDSAEEADRVIAVLSLVLHTPGRQSPALHSSLSRILPRFPCFWIQLRNLRLDSSARTLAYGSTRDSPFSPPEHRGHTIRTEWRMESSSSPIASQFSSFCHWLLICESRVSSSRRLDSRQNITLSDSIHTVDMDCVLGGARY